MTNYTEASYDLSVEEVLRLPGFQHLKKSTLAKWRQLGEGPKFVIIGRRAFYSKTEIDAWKKKKADSHELKKEIRNVVLPFQDTRTELRTEHRFGRHQTKRKRGEDYGGTVPT